jgi:uncharacterized membrane protein
VTDAAVTPRRPWIFAVFLVVAGALGWWAAFSLTLDKFLAYEHKAVKLSCDFNPLVQCTANLNSPEGSAFGFPNPLIGLGGFAAVIAVGVSILAGARFARWYWILFNLGVAGALAFVIFLIRTSIYRLGTLCPWCMLVWSVTIPLFIALTIRNLAEGVYGSGGVRVGRALRPWIIPITVICYLIVAVLAQLQLNVLAVL